MHRTNSTTKVSNTFKTPVVTHLCDTKMSGSGPETEIANVGDLARWKAYCFVKYSRSNR